MPNPLSFAKFAIGLTPEGLAAKVGVSLASSLISSGIGSAAKAGYNAATGHNSQAAGQDAASGQLSDKDLNMILAGLKAEQASGK